MAYSIACTLAVRTSKGPTFIETRTCNGAATFIRDETNSTNNAIAGF